MPSPPPAVSGPSEDRPEPRAPRSLALDGIAAAFSRADLTVSVAGPGEYAEIEALSHAAPPGEVYAPVTAALLRWFTDENPHGPGFVVIARDGRSRELVGHFLYYANTLVYAAGGAERTIPAYLYVHLYVAPSHRRNGVFAAMFAFGAAVLTAMGVGFAYTVPNPRSSPGFVKFGVPLLGTLPCWMAPSVAAWRGAASLLSPGRPAIDVTRVTAFDGTMIPARRDSAAVFGQRTAERLNWRFGRRPGVEHALWRVSVAGDAPGVVVTRVMTIARYRVLAFCDWSLPGVTGAALRGLVGRIVRESEPSDLVMAQGGSPDRAARRAFWNAGFVRVPDRFLPQPIAVFGGAPGVRGATAGLPMLDRWRLTPGDWDVF
jgi:GNAT superfamily N-acetyltransferase